MSRRTDGGNRAPKGGTVGPTRGPTEDQTACPAACIMRLFDESLARSKRDRQRRRRVRRPRGGDDLPRPKKRCSSTGSVVTVRRCDGPKPRAAPRSPPAARPRNPIRRRARITKAHQGTCPGRGGRPAPPPAKPKAARCASSTSASFRHAAINDSSGSGSASDDDDDDDSDASDSDRGLSSSRARALPSSRNRAGEAPLRIRDGRPKGAPPMSGDEGNVRREDVPVRRTERRRQYTDPHRGWRCTETVRTTIVKGRQPKGARSSPRPPAKTEPAPVGEEAHRANDGPESVREESESWPSPPRPFPAAGFGDGDARELVSLWRRVFPDARLLGELGTPSRSGGVVIVVHRVPLGCREHATNRRDAITVNGLFARSALAGALGYYSVERTGGSTLNLYRVTLPDLPGCGGRRSVLQCYVSALAAAGMGIASASPSRDWSGASVFPACVPLTTVAHQSADMDAGAFSRLTLQALDGAVQLARVGIARIESDPSTRARALCALTIFPSSASGPLPHERPRLAAACREMGHDRGASRPLVGGGVGDRADDGPCGDVDTPDGDGDPEAERASGHVPGVGARATRGRAPSRGRVPLRAVTTRVIQCNGYDGVGAEAWNEALTAPPRAAEADSDDDDAGASVAAGSCAWDARNARWSLRDRFDAHKRTIPN